MMFLVAALACCSVHLAEAMRGFSANRSGEADLEFVYPPHRRRSNKHWHRAPHIRGLTARLTEIAQAHPEAERFEIWSQDEARVGQKGRTGYIWWQRGHTPRGLRDVGHQSAWIIGAVCPARATGHLLPWGNCSRRPLILT